MNRAILLSLIFIGIILAVMGVLFNFTDQRARIRIHKILLKYEKPNAKSSLEKFKPYLAEIRVPALFRSLLNERKIVASGIDLEARQFYALWWVLSLLGISLLMTGFIIKIPGYYEESIGITAAALAIGGPYLYLRRQCRSRIKALRKELPYFLDMLTFMVEAGLGLVPALIKVSSKLKGVLSKEIEESLTRIELGYSLTEALRFFSSRAQILEINHFVEAVLLSERLGTSLARTLRIQSKLLRSQRHQQAQAFAQTAPIRIIPALVFFFLPGLLLIYLAPPILSFLLG